MEEEREESGISIGDIFRTIFSQKWLALIIAAIITIVGTVGLYLMGKSDMEYSVSFVLQLPDTDDSPSTYRYPDGTPFYYTDIISADNLAIAKASVNGDIDTEKMLKDGDISIARVINETETSSDTVEIYDLLYKVNVKAKYFKDGDSARDFVVALAGIPVAHIGEMKIDYDYNITASRTALTYEAQLTELENQVRALQNLYNSFISSNGANFIVALDGATSKTLTTLRSESVDEYLNKGLFGTLKREAYDNGYVKSTTDTRERDKYESEKKELQERLTVAENTLTKLLDLQSASGSIIYADSIRAQIIEVEQLTIELEKHTQKYLDNFDNGEVNAEFEAKVKTVENEVKKLTEDIKPIASYVYKNVSKVNYVNSKIIEVDGGRSLIMSGAISLVVGIVLAAIVAYIVGWSRQKKTVRSNKTVAEVPVFVEAQAQAAVTEDKEEDIKEDK